MVLDLELGPVAMTTTFDTATLDRHGLHHTGTAYWNLSPAALYEEAVRRGEGTVAAGGPIVVITKPHTGRSPNDKFVVRESESEQKVWWGNVNQPFEPAGFERLQDEVLRYLDRLLSCHLWRELNYRSHWNHFSCRFNGLDGRRLQSFDGRRCQLDRRKENGLVCCLRQFDSPVLWVYKLLAPLAPRIKPRPDGFRLARSPLPERHYRFVGRLQTVIGDR